MIEQNEPYILILGGEFPPGSESWQAHYAHPTACEC